MPKGYVNKLSRGASPWAVLIWISVILVSACGRDRAEDPSVLIYRALEGRTLVHETGPSVTLERDGRLSGVGITGTWWVSGRQVCRHILAPETRIGTTCQFVQINADRVVFLNPHGRNLSFQIVD